MDISVGITRILLAALLGAIVGLERELTQKSAGLRTHILVTLGATLFTLVSMADFYHDMNMGPFEYVPGMPVSTLNRDPSRVAAQIVSGIGFIGGGAVLRYGTTVKGLTTAASLWIMASIGMLVGVGQYRLSIIATLVAFLVLFTIGKIERQVFTKHIPAFNRIRLSITSKGEHSMAAQSWVEEHYKKSEIMEAKTKSDLNTEKLEMHYVLNTSAKKMDVNEISRQVCRIPGVISSTVKSYYESEDPS